MRSLSRGGDRTLTPVEGTSGIFYSLGVVAPPQGVALDLAGKLLPHSTHMVQYHALENDIFFSEIFSENGT